MIEGLEGTEVILVEVAPNQNCDPVDLRIFNDIEAPRQVSAVRLERQAGCPAWYDVVGWTPENAPCSALAYKVDDSGDGTAILMCGGSAGLRLRPSGSTGPWHLNVLEQWGEPFLIVGDLSDIRHG